jgi:hypothetical protein
MAIKQFDRPAPEPGEKQSRERSSIEFPYGDIEDATLVAMAIHENAGVSCSPDQLAAYMHHVATSGTFRLRVSTARVFGLIETERGAVSLTPLGRTIVDPSNERHARVDAFMSVPLYRAIFEKYKGHLLPPPAALEREMANLGVSSKQTDKARQAFERSAQKAGFFEHGSDRLVMPSSSSRGSDSQKSEAPASVPEPLPTVRFYGGGGGGHSDPLIQALIQKLPETGPWPVDERVNWLKLLSMAFQMTYGQEQQIEIKKEASN